MGGRDEHHDWEYLKEGKHGQAGRCKGVSGRIAKSSYTVPHARYMTWLGLYRAYIGMMQKKTETTKGLGFRLLQR